MTSDAYQRDFHAWTHRQAALLRERRFEAVDVENIAEEIESMGRREKREIVDRLALLLSYLMRWRLLPGFRSASVKSSVREQRLRLRYSLEDDPSLEAGIDEAWARAYELAVITTARDTGMPESDFPAECPYRIEQAADAEFWPD